MILDSGETLFVWLGRESNRQEREAVLTTAKDYLLSDPSGRDVDIPVILVKQGHEPPHFTGYFGAWDINLWPVNRHTFYQGTMLENYSKMSHLEFLDFGIFITIFVLLTLSDRIRWICTMF